ncbi:MAG: extracellular solute-binding protein, partial [Pseudoflavonifractor sp.]
GPDKLTAAITAGTAPDVLFDAPGRIIEYGNAGYLVSLDDMIGALKSDLASESLVQTCVGTDGTAYMYPISSSPFYMGLNKEALEKADALQYVNLEGDRTWTTDNFVKMCEALAKKAPTTVPAIVYCGAQGGDQGTRGLVNNLYGSSIVGKDGKWNIDEKGVKALTLLQDMYNKKSIDAGFDMAAGDELQKFQNETCAMTFCFGTSAEVTYKSDSYTQIAVPFPSDDGKPELEYLVNGFCVFNNKDDAKAEAAKKLVAFICDDAEWGPKSVVKTNAFPVRTSFGDLYPGDEHKAMLASWSQYYGPYYNTRAGFPAMRPLWFNMLQQVFKGTAPQTAADEFNAKANG